MEILLEQTVVDSTSTVQSEVIGVPRSHSSDETIFKEEVGQVCVDVKHNLVVIGRTFLSRLFLCP